MSRHSIRCAALACGLLLTAGCTTGAAPPNAADAGGSGASRDELAHLLITRLIPTAASNFSNGFTVTNIIIDRMADRSSVFRAIQLEPPFSYRITAVGGTGTRDLDLRLVDDADRLLAQDTAAGQSAVVEFSPYAGTDLRILLEHAGRDVSGDRREPSYFIILVARSGSVESTAPGARQVDPVEEIVTTLDYLLAYVNGVTENGLIPQHIEMDRVRSGETASLRYPLGAGTRYAILGGGGAGTTDLDMAIRDSRQNLIDEDDDPDNSPALTLTPGSDQTYSVEAHLYGTEDGYPDGHEFWFFWILTTDSP